jgi:hypothetical protein
LEEKTNKKTKLVECCLECARRNLHERRESPKYNIGGVLEGEGVAIHEYAALEEIVMKVFRDDGTSS